MTASLKRNLLYNVLLNVSAVAFPLVTAPYVARVLQPDNVGLFNFANTYAGYFAIMAALGIPTYGVREIAKRRDDKKAAGRLLDELFSLNVYTTAIVSLLYLATLFTIGRMRMNLAFFVLAGLVVYTKPFSIEWYYQGLENFGFITLRTLAVRTASVAGLFLFVRDANDVFKYMLLNCLGTVAGQIWNCAVLARSGMRLRLVARGLGQHVKPVLLLFASAVAISIYTALDTVMLGFLSGYSQVAYYHQASHLSKLVLSVVTSLSIVAMPRVSYYVQNRAWDEVNALIRKSFGIVALVAIPAALGLVASAPAFVPWFFGDGYAGTVVPLQIMAFVIVAIGFNNLLGVQVLLGMGLDRMFLASVLVGTASNFAMNCFAIPRWGAVGASVASVAAEFLVLAAQWHGVRARTAIRIGAAGDIAKSLLGATAFFPLSFLLLQKLDGWRYLAAFVPSGMLLYFAIEFAAGNRSLLFFKSIVVKKFGK